jgi:biopolymer transport protein ExbB/TolQ
MSGALLTTALGLMAAMPASVAYNYLASRIDALLDQIDSLSQSWAGRLASEPRVRPISESANLGVGPHG